MLKPPEHQVAGHEAGVGGGKYGPLIDGAGHFYKPLQPGDERGEHEVAFYTSLSSNPAVPDSIRAFFPSFGGTRQIPNSEGVLLPHLELEDLLHGYSAPCVMDVKIGARTWYPGASEKYFEKCIKKDRESTSAPLGFRISGLQVHHESGCWKPDRDIVKKYSSTDVRRSLRQFVSKKPSSENRRPDCALALSIYGGSSGVLAQLTELKAWFEHQTLFHFYSTSVLISYDMMGGKGKGVRVKLVDFAHVLEGDGVIDHNFLGGICSLIKFVSVIMDEVKAGNGNSEVCD